jgi:hypothetical protein
LDIATVLAQLKKQRREIERAIAALEEIKPARRRAPKTRASKSEPIVSIVRGREKAVNSGAFQREKRKADILEFPAIARRAR